MACKEHTPFIFSSIGGWFLGSIKGLLYNKNRGIEY